MAYSYGYKLIEEANEEAVLDAGIAAVRYALGVNCFIGESVLSNMITWTLRHRRSEFPHIMRRIYDRFMSDVELQEIERLSRVEEQVIEALRPDHRTIGERMLAVLDCPIGELREPRPIMLIY